MADMSDSSRTWFTLVMKEVERAYLAYLRASPIDRLALRPEEPENLVSGAYHRVHARAATMLMSSLPAEVKSELVATRRTSVISMLFRLAVLYQPAGEQERMLILRKRDCLYSHRGRDGSQILGPMVSSEQGHWCGTS